MLDRRMRADLGLTLALGLGSSKKPSWIILQPCVVKRANQFEGFVPCSHCPFDLVLFNLISVNICKETLRI